MICHCPGLETTTPLTSLHAMMKRMSLHAVISRADAGFCAVSLHLIYRSSPALWPKLYRRRVKHDADRGTEGLGREVGPEFGADNAAVAVGPGDLAPDDADLGALDGALGAVDVCLVSLARAPWGCTYMLRACQRTTVRRPCCRRPRASGAKFRGSCCAFCDGERGTEVVVVMHTLAGSCGR